MHPTTLLTGFHLSLLMTQSTIVVYLRNGFHSASTLMATLPLFLAKVFTKIKMAVVNGVQF